MLSERVKEYRAKTFRLLPHQRVKTREQAVSYVNERGFVFFWPINGIPMPSLWMAVAGNRPVAEEHDDPSHITWSWKDELLGGREWYYAKVLRKKATMISFEVLPYFYALSENYGAPEEDYLTLYEQGRLTQEAKAVYEALLTKGALDTIALRKASYMSSPASESRFNRALSDLQADFKILPVAVAEVGAWRYAFIYDIFTRHYPDIPEKAQSIGENEARCKLVEVYFRSLGAARLPDVCKLFAWKPTHAEKAVNDLVAMGKLRRGLRMENQPGEWIALTELV